MNSITPPYRQEVAYEKMLRDLFLVQAGILIISTREAMPTIIEQAAPREDALSFSPADWGAGIIRLFSNLQATI